jgi:2-acylglycerol O-acyltransferase 2
MQGIGVHVVPQLQSGTGALANLHVVAADAVFQVPIFREICLSLGMRSASNRVMDKLLEDGDSVALAPGGIHEQVKTNPEREQLFFAPNLGFVRTAMKHGVPLVPLYNFGENQLYETPTWCERISKSLKKFGIGFKPVVGRWNLPLPLPQKVETRFGREIAVGPPNPNPTDAQVEQVFRMYCHELLRLFDEHKSALPPAVAARGLSIVWRGHESVDLSKKSDDAITAHSSTASRRSRL